MRSAINVERHKLVRWKQRNPKFTEFFCIAASAFFQTSCFMVSIAAVGFALFSSIFQTFIFLSPVAFVGEKICNGE